MSKDNARKDAIIQALKQSNSNRTSWQAYHARSGTWIDTRPEHIDLYRRGGVPVRQVRQLTDGRLKVIDADKPTSSPQAATPA